MKQLLEIVKHQLKQLFRNKTTILATIAGPIILTLLFSSVDSDEQMKKLYVLDYDESVYSQQLLNTIKHDNNIEIIVTDREDINNNMEEQKGATAIIIEKGFGDNLVKNSGLSLKVMQNYESPENVMLEQMISSKVSVFKNIIEDSNYAAKEFSNLGVNSRKEDIFKEAFNQINSEWQKPSQRLVKYETTSKQEKSIDWTTQASIGFLVFFLCFVVVQGIRTFIEEKENRTFTRFLTTPTSYNKIMFGKVISIFIYGAIQMTILVVLAKFLFNIEWFNNILSISIILVLYLFTLICMCMLFIPYMKTQQQLNNVSALIVTIASLLGGTFFPLDIAPQFVRTIAKITPQRWAMIGLIDAGLNNNPLSSQITTIIVLASMGLVALIISLVLMNRQLRYVKGEVN